MKRDNGNVRTDPYHREALPLKYSDCKSLKKNIL